jgi:hypothetical protein
MDRLAEFGARPSQGRVGTALPRPTVPSPTSAAEGVVGVWLAEVAGSVLQDPEQEPKAWDGFWSGRRRGTVRGRRLWLGNTSGVRHLPLWQI